MHHREPGGFIATAGMPDRSTSQFVCKIWWQCAKGPKWRTTRTTLPLIDGSGNIIRLAGWRADELTLRELPPQGKAQMRIVTPAARGNAGKACCQRKHRHNPAKMAPFFTATYSKIDE